MLLLVALSTASIERRRRPDYEQQCAAVSSSIPLNLRRQTSSVFRLTYGGIRSRCQREDTYRHMILASGIQGMEGFHQHWSLHGHLEDTERRLEALNQGIEKRKADMIQGEPKRDPVRKKWVFWQILFALLLFRIMLLISKGFYSSIHLKKPTDLKLPFLVDVINQVVMD
ncbi:hypothetical protein C4D60_Mb03t09540 [Musa balbisiana]|uniref:DUF7803 domain-containing protein n=1 Tax=Musa balbisiana TaxID=52838 RepID=A0A4S8JAG6_MUSBA|nr:hypothetical protein C4D60_Mb03t09540 [Musa balbisiana]